MRAGRVEKLLDHLAHSSGAAHDAFGSAHFGTRELLREDEHRSERTTKIVRDHADESLVELECVLELFARAHGIGHQALAFPRVREIVRHVGDDHTHADDCVACANRKVARAHIASPFVRSRVDAIEDGLARSHRLPNVRLVLRHIRDVLDRWLVDLREPLVQSAKSHVAIDEEEPDRCILEERFDLGSRFVESAAEHRLALRPAPKRDDHGEPERDRRHRAPEKVDRRSFCPALVAPHELSRGIELVAKIVHQTFSARHVGGEAITPFTRLERGFRLVDFAHLQLGGGTNRDPGLRTLDLSKPLVPRGLRGNVGLQERRIRRREIPALSSLRVDEDRSELLEVGQHARVRLSIGSLHEREDDRTHERHRDGSKRPQTHSRLTVMCSARFSSAAGLYSLQLREAIERVALRDLEGHA